ncbi:MAG: LacI family DNA-binding transcriptional regulator [Cyclobacteriaceae bacterium]|nr:LacI family DNA-binding transcriptional regulator [Cyclobacteriaceae bacterium]
MSVTIKDIAKMLNVSHTTVSRALNDSPLISRETRQRVIELAEKYHYQPNVMARSLVLSKSYNVGLFFSTLQSGTTAQFFLESVRAVSMALRGTYRLSLQGIDELEDPNSIDRRHYDGILLMSQDTRDDDFIKILRKKSIPLVVMNREVDIPEVHSVLANDEIAAWQLTDHLITHGHTNIAIIEGKKNFRTSVRRKEGFLRAVTESALQIDESHMVIGDYDISGGFRAMNKLLDLQAIPTAVFCSNDDMAVGAMKAIFARGLSVPYDISLTGFDDNGYSAYLSPALTTVKRPVEAMGEAAARMLIQLMEMGTAGVPEKTLRLDHTFMERESVRSLKS